jgi:2Fe-2S ferredoxin
MPRITYIQHDGTPHVVDVGARLTVMEGAVLHDIAGILADCGGDGGCATCHVYVEEAWRSRTGECSRGERATLRFALKTDQRSRLACQIIVTDELDGLVVHLPERQF